MHNISGCFYVQVIILYSSWARLWFLYTRDDVSLQPLLIFVFVKKARFRTRKKKVSQTILLFTDLH